MKPSFFLAILVCLSALGFSQTKISGAFTEKVLFEKAELFGLESQEPIASCPIDKDGKFKLSTAVSETNYFRLSFAPQQSLLLILGPNQKINLKLNPKQLDTPIIEGSPESEHLLTINKSLADFSAKEEELLMRYELNQKLRKEYIIRQISKSPSSLTNIFFLDHLDYQKDNETVVKMIKEMYKAHPKNKFIRQLADELDKSKQPQPQAIEVGQAAPEIELPTPDGKLLKLSSLKGKYVLIDFWASWCSPCRMENPNNVKLYEKYKSKGFEIFAVSLDKNKESWIAAIKKDKLSWLHVSDLKYWQSEAAQTYGVTGIPYTVLLDKAGLIIATGLRGDALAQKLNQLLGE